MGAYDDSYGARQMSAAFGRAVCAVPATDALDLHFLQSVYRSGA
jgi:hypothetical protein